MFWLPGDDLFSQNLADKTIVGAETFHDSVRNEKRWGRFALITEQRDDLFVLFFEVSHLLGDVIGIEKDKFSPLISE